MTIEIEKLLAWSEPKEVRTKLGPRMLRKAAPTEAFWALWRTSKDALKAAGVSLGKNQQVGFAGEWEVCLWQPLPKDEQEKRAAAIEASRATDAAIEIPAPEGISYLPYQKAGIKFGANKSGVLFCDEVGLGKTCQSLASAALTGAFPLLIIGPASLKINWRNEIDKFFPGLETVIVNGHRRENQKLSSLWGGIHAVALQPKAEVLFNRVRGQAQQRQGERQGVGQASYIDLPRVQAAVRPAPVSRAATDGETEGVLRASVRDQSEKQGTGQPGAPAGSSRKAESVGEGAGQSDQFCARLDRQEDHAGSVASPDAGVRVGVESHRADEHAQSGETAEVLDRPGVSGDEGRGGDRRRQPPASGAQGEGRAQRRVPSSAGLESHPSHEQGSDGAGAGCRGPHIVICNYDLLESWKGELIAAGFKGVIADEIHYAKSQKTKRAKALKEICQDIPHRYGLTGTIILNRPQELWMPLSIIAPALFPKFFPFAKRYCDAKQNGWGWDFSGASHLDELQEKLRSSGCFIRRLKKEVLKELPPIRRQLIEIATNDDDEDLVREENESFARHENEITRLKAAAEVAKLGDDEAAYKAAVDALRNAYTVAFAEVAKLRHQIALAKVPSVVAHVSDLLEDTQKLVIFTHHHDVTDSIAAELAEHGASIVDGRTPNEQRQEIVDRFNAGQDKRVLLLGIRAAGVGLSIRASVELFAELDWTPGVIAQAEGRCHGVGRGIEGEPLLVQHLILEGSLDARMARVIVQKQEIADRALDKGLAAQEVQEPVLTVTLGSVLESVNEGPMLSGELVALAHQGVQSLAAMDRDRARDLNGMGFNRLDCAIGHKLANQSSLSPRQALLAAKLCIRYRRQLGDEQAERFKAAME